LLGYRVVKWRQKRATARARDEGMTPAPRQATV